MNGNIESLRGVLELFIENSNRMNNKKEQKYWYPLSMATYDIDEILEALDCMCSFRTTMSEKTSLFEKEFAKYIGCSHAIMVNSGSSADLLLAHLLKGKIKDPKKDVVIVSAVTWPTHIWSILNAGFKIRIVDVDPNTLNIDLLKLKNEINDNIAAIFLVHLMGNPNNIYEIKNIIEKKDIFILEDCCEALGSDIDGIKVGNFGLGGAYSFFFSHHITTMEGGMVVLNDDDLAKRAKILRAHGWTRNINSIGDLNIDSRYTFVDIGFNFRPTELQAAFGIHQLKKLDVFNLRRDILFNKIMRFVRTTDFLSCPISFGKPSWLGIPFLINKEAPFNRKELILYLESNGIETRPIVAGNIVRQPVINKIKLCIPESLDGADQVHNYGFYLGLSPMFSDQQINKLIDILNIFIKKY